MAKPKDTPKTAEGSEQERKPRRMRVARLRKYALGVVSALIVIGLVAGIGSGTICSVGCESIAAVCPLGALESLLGTGTPVARVVIVAAGAAAAVLIAGKAFCSWACPIPSLDRFLSGRKRRRSDRIACTEAARHVGERLTGCSECTGCAAGEGAFDDKGKEIARVVRKTPKRRFAKIDGRHVVLGAALVSTAVCGFPAFCLICPVGLVFATAIAIYRLVGFNEPTLDLLVFPLIIVAELTLLRRWCHRFCPIGALMSLVANFNKATRPKVDSELCLRKRGVSCTACAGACPEFIDPVDDLGDRALAECTRCGRCADACPVDAIRFTKKGLTHGN